MSKFLEPSSHSFSFGTDFTKVETKPLPTSAPAVQPSAGDGLSELRAAIESGQIDPALLGLHRDDLDDVVKTKEDVLNIMSKYLGGGGGVPASKVNSLISDAFAAKLLEDQVRAQTDVRGNIRLTAVGDTGHFVGYDYTNVNEPIGGLQGNALDGGWVKQIGTTGVLEVAFPRLVFWGDSHTAIAATTHEATWEADANVNTRLAAIGGQNTFNIIDLFESMVVPADPQILMISAGSNDVWSGVSEKQSKENFLTILDLGFSTGAYVMVQLPGPSNDDFGGLFTQENLSRLKRFNEWAETVCQNRNIPYINSMKEFSTDYENEDFTWVNSTLTSDGLHRTTSGERAVIHHLKANFDVPLLLESVELVAYLNSADPAASTAAMKEAVVNWGAREERYSHMPFLPVVSIKPPTPSHFTLGATLSTGDIGFTIDPVEANLLFTGIAAVYARMSSKASSAEALPDTNNAKRNYHPASRTEFFDDFMASSSQPLANAGSVIGKGWTVRTDGLGNANVNGVVAPASPSSHPGCVSLSTQDDSSGVAILELGSDTSMTVGNGIVTCEALVYVPELWDAPDDFFLSFGLGDQSSSAASSDFMGFTYDGSLSANWATVTARNGYSSSADTGVAVASEWVRLRLETSFDASFVRFYINDALVSFQSTNLLTSSVGDEVGPVFAIEKRAGTNARTLVVDYYHHLHEFITRR